ncbi:MAG: sulfatase-like hydrolase/transferase [Planctomycetaceae bacterium]|nr:sulfatase-like hydrolase/transferase [Planctomycetaceae bacterium]
MRNGSVWPVALAMLLPLSGCQEHRVAERPSIEPTRPPNIIVIYSDDQGFADLGVHGVDSDIRTPQLDAMAQAGVLCTRGYVSAPQCVPSRAGLLTGRYQQRFGVDDNLNGPLPLEQLTLAELLSPADYVCGQVGKWHLNAIGNPGAQRDTADAGDGDERDEMQGRHDPFLPFGQGFHEYFCGGMNSFVASHDLRGQRLRDAPEIVTDRRFRVEVQTDAALNFIRRHAKEPFFLYLAYFTPHVPLESPEPFFSETPPELPLERRQALAMMAAMDNGIGRIRSLLRDQAIEQDTLVFFISDNGAPLLKGAWDGSLNTPLVGEKGMLTDGGVRVPWLVEWPGTVPAGARYEQPVSSLDVASTAIAAAGLPPDARLDGVDLVPYLDGSRSDPPHDAIFWRWRSQAAILKDGWKLIRLGADERYLFDLSSPEGERQNRLNQFPDRAADLERRLLDWDSTLQSPGLPVEVHRQDALFYRVHLDRERAGDQSQLEQESATRVNAAGEP